MRALLEPVFRAGETFPHDPAITETEAQMAWVEQNRAVMLAMDVTGALLGTYYLRPNSLALGAHVANAGYVVAEHCRRQGIGSRLPALPAGDAATGVSADAVQPGGEHQHGWHPLLAAQWLSGGGHPAWCVRHRQLGYVDALVMVQALVEGPE